MEEGIKKEQHHCTEAPKILRFAHSWCLLLSLFAISAGARAFDYADALRKSLLYFESQRSGRLPYNQRVTWRDHSGLTDGLEQGVDLVGGYYDAGDHVKFGLPMAFTVTMLSWGVIEFRKQIAVAGELEHAMEAIKWGTDYFIKAHTSPNVLWAEVGDGDTDHYCWQRPEDMTTSRQAYKIDENNPGSDLAGETAAAMAAASIVFKRTNPHYSHLLLHHAHQLLMEEKHKEHSHILEQYRSKAEYYICACLGLNENNGSNVERTPGGLLYIRQWNNMQYVSTAAFLLSVYSDYLQNSNQNLKCHGKMVGHEEILNFAKSQIDYILGSNPMSMSYLVGYGSNYPTRVHHRGASIVSYREHKGFIGCTQGYDHWFSRQEPNSNVLVGALVGGPDSQDDFVDQRHNYMQTEACTYNTAPLVGVLAKLLHLEDLSFDQNHSSPLVASY
ncbi:hypothetical protein F2P56_022342 [Juglans regia]|uniref:Endoglucanase n=2 Tax=Juglans regia TaxID=51240 RepID=A0A2I4GX42_JUGRE|nr:endoglucanase 11-like isoform X2 [Juglans regia]KAF5458306.1 hypothetical protein F2P56_022342 [Juglans regia]